jgi:hypothetical protein
MFRKKRNVDHIVILQEMWFYQLSLASLSGRDETLELTPTEQFLATIFREGGALGRHTDMHRLSVM